jgi:hypothetical protein
VKSLRAARSCCRSRRSGLLESANAIVCAGKYMPYDGKAYCFTCPTVTYQGAIACTTTPATTCPAGESIFLGPVVLPLDAFAHQPCPRKALACRSVCIAQATTYPLARASPGNALFPNPAFAAGCTEPSCSILTCLQRCRHVHGNIGRSNGVLAVPPRHGHRRVCCHPLRQLVLNQSPISQSSALRAWSQ